MFDAIRFMIRHMLPAAAIAAAPLALAQSQLPGGPPVAGGGAGAFPSNPALRSFQPNAGFGLGGTPINRPYSPMSGNQFASGNVRGGFALRSFSPISDPTAFRASLGSGSLSNFIRDSVSVYDAYGAGAGTPYSPYAPFYDPARTAPTAGFLSGQTYPDAVGGFTKPNEFGSVNRTAPGMLNYGSPVLQRFDPLASRTGALPPMSTSIFGVMPVNPVELNQPIKPIGDPITPLREPPNSARFPGANTAENTADRGQFDTRVMPKPVVEPLGKPLDVVLKSNAQDLLPALATPTLLDRRPVLSDAARDPRREPTAPTVSALRDASMLPGNDVFTDMRLAMALITDPKAADVFRDMQKAADGMARPTGKAAAQEIESAAFIDRLTKAPLRSFVGEGTSPLNDEMLKGESLLQIGQYYDAARRFERAALLDPGNPLPNIGRGHALLAAGDYLSAGLSLVRGLERYPEITRFDVDLKSFFKSGEIIDIRRADLMQQLERREDPTLRFLLGYLEYYTGDRERGMGNLEKAANEADPGSIIRRYPALLRSDATPPPPKMPPTEKPAAPVPSGKDGE